MTKLEFMKELESLLLDIPLEEREEALRYYNGYFEDAGEDHEEEIMNELGSPKKVAKFIKADLNSNAADRENSGFFTEKGYRDTVTNEYEIVGTAKKETGDNNQAGSTNNANSNQYTNQGQSQNTQQQSGRNTGLIVLIAILAFPFWFPFLMAIFGIVIGIVATIFGIVFGFGAAGLAMIGAGIALFIAGLIQISVPLVGAMMIGCGLLVLGLGMMFLLASILLCKKVLPAVIRGFVALCRLPFKNRSVMA